MLETQGSASILLKIEINDKFIIKPSYSAFVLAFTIKWFMFAGIKIQRSCDFNSKTINNLYEAKYFAL